MTLHDLQQSAYFAHWLSRDGTTEDALTQTIAGAKVDMNPHQVDAALFALRSPLSSGALLADEVGLGKTIEASLLLAQKWAEQKRRLLLIVPATLRKQWAVVICSYEFASRKQIEAKNDRLLTEVEDIIVLRHQRQRLFAARWILE